ncbi:lipid II:glycine glycyltransferase FemX [Planococcus shixiaomingii]|uniref:lipid II:glycine glycyltransferase FemX n=1 Tax=Planococcus shixiaomingii TaxID=3058393 RepID=UPI00262346A0|nr:GNAT family N-acetyltransferase [Planococcus sp. N022]WKA53857.1 GNAT family N-acetyltransferase [Planococcus sp. N022]
MTNVPDIYFLPEWGKSYEGKDGGELKIFEFENNIGHVFYQFLLRPIPIENGQTIYFDIITPYGFSGPVIISCEPNKREELVASFNAEFQKYCEKHNIVAEYIRFNPWLNNKSDFENVYNIKDNGSTVFIDLTVDDFFADEFSSNSRTQVRRARKNNVEIEYDFTGASIQEFHRLYNIMAKRQNINDYYLFTEEFLTDSFKRLKGKQFIISAKHEGKYVSASLFLHHGDYLHYHLTANDPEYFHLAANSLIVYEGCRWGKENGKKELHLGGILEHTYRFKRGFTKRETLEFKVGTKVRNEEIYNVLVDYKKRENEIRDISYFPLYRG